MSMQCARWDPSPLPAVCRFVFLVLLRQAGSASVPSHRFKSCIVAQVIVSNSAHAILLSESLLRLPQVVAAALNSSMSVPQAAWSRDFVEEAILAELTADTPSSSNSSSNTACDDSGCASSSDQQVPLSLVMQDLVQQFQQFQQFHQAAAANNSNNSTAAAASSRSTSKQRNSTGSKTGGSSKLNRKVDHDVPDVLLHAPGLVQQLQEMFGQLLQDNYQEVEDADVAAFGIKLLQELARLVDAALSAQQEDAEGLCQLCERDMPLTKHHLIPRDVQKDFKKKGFGFQELQSGVMVCRPCHSCIHRAVPDNKELGLHYRTLESLKQHNDIARFAAWARRQRVSSKVDAESMHFRYRR